MLEQFGFIAKRDFSGMRYYYNMAAKNISETYRASVTTILGRVMPKGVALESWFKDKGHFSNIVRDTASVMGTVVHQCIEDLLRGIKIDEQYILACIDRMERKAWVLQMTKHEFVYKVRRYMESYMAFWDEYNPTIMGNELPLWHWDIGWAGQTDQLYAIQDKKGNNIITLIDNKTGSQNENHFIQQSAYKILLEKMYDVKIDKIGVLYVRESYRDKPTFTLKVKDANYGEEMWNAVYEMFLQQHHGNPTPKTKHQPRKEFKIDLSTHIQNKETNNE